MLNDVNASCGISSPQQAVNSMSKRSFSLDGELCKISFISILIFFLSFKHDFIGCVHLTRIAASNTASDDVTN